MRAAAKAYAEFGAALQSKAEEIKPLGLRVEFKQADTYVIASLYPIHMICNWWAYYSNVMEDVTLNITWNLGFPQGIPGFWGSPDGHRTLQTKKFSYGLVRPGVEAYYLKSEPNRDWSPDSLADHVLKVLIDVQARNKGRD